LDFKKLLSAENSVFGKDAQETLQGVTPTRAFRFCLRPAFLPALLFHLTNPMQRPDSPSPKTEFWAIQSF